MLRFLIVVAAAVATVHGSNTAPPVPALMISRRTMRNGTPSHHLHSTVQIQCHVSKINGYKNLDKRLRQRKDTTLLRGGAVSPGSLERDTATAVVTAPSSVVPSQQQQQPLTETVPSLNSTVPAAAKLEKETTHGSAKKEDPRVMFLIRVLFLVYYGSLGSIMPYLPVYYHSLGHGGQIIGLLGAVKPATTFIVAPLWGAVSDQTNNPFLILQLTFVTSLLGQLLVGASHDPWYITIMVFLTAVFNAPVKSLLDTMVMDHIHDRSSYGRLRLWGQLGFGLGSSGVGYLLSKSKDVSWSDTASFSPSFEESLSRYPVALQTSIKYASKCWQSMTGYKLLFLAYAILSIPTWMCIKAFQKLDGEAKQKNNGEQNHHVSPLPETKATEASSEKVSKAIEASSEKVSKATEASSEKVSKATEASSEKVSKDVSSSTSEIPRESDTSVRHGLSLVLHDPDALLFFFLVLVVGISSGVIENFAYVRIREVGGTGKEMGISRLVSSVAGVPMFWFSGPLAKNLGVDRVMVLSLVSYVIRFIMYGTMQNPYQGLPAEALRGVTFAAFWSSATIYAHKVSPPGLHATMLMLVNAMYGGLGQSLGAIWGGKLQHKLGTVKTFLYSALADFILTSALIVYLGARTDSSFRNPKPIEDTRQLSRSAVS